LTHTSAQGTVKRETRMRAPYGIFGAVVSGLAALVTLQARGVAAADVPPSLKARLVATMPTDAFAIAFTADGSKIALLSSALSSGVSSARLSLASATSPAPLPALRGGEVAATRGFAPILAASGGSLVVFPDEVFDSATGELLTLPEPQGYDACHVSYSASGARAALSCLGYEDVVFVVDTATGTRIGKYPAMKGAGHPEGGSISADGAFVHVTHRGAGSFIGVASRRNVHPSGSEAQLSTTGRYLFASNLDGCDWFIGTACNFRPSLLRSRTRAVVYPLPAWVGRLQFSRNDGYFVPRPGGPLSAGGPFPETTDVYATSSSSPIVRIGVPIDEVDDTAFSPDEKHIALLAKGSLRLYVLE
jgi:hypothetical protein